MNMNRLLDAGYTNLRSLPQGSAMCLKELFHACQVRPFADIAHGYCDTQPGSVLSPAQQHLYWGIQHYRQKQFDQAVKNFETALHFHTQVQDWVEVGRTLNGLSAVYLQIRNHGRALAYSQASASILEGTIAHRDHALAVYQLGMSYLNLQNLAAAEQYFEQALALYQELQDGFNEDRALLNLGQIYAKRREFMFALAAYEAVLDSVLKKPLEDENVQELLLSVLGLMMQLCDATNRADAVIVPYQDVVNRYASTGDHQKVAEIFQNLGQFHESRQRYGIALECYAQALKIVPPTELAP